MPNLGIAEIVVGVLFWIFLIVGGRAAIAGRGASLPVSGPPLVLQKFFLDSTGRAPNLVEIQGRAQGFISWLLTAMSLDATTSLIVTRNEISFRSAKLSGERAIVVPLSSVASLQYGYSKPIILIWLSVIIVGLSLWAGLSMNNSWLLLGGFALSAILLIAYVFSKKMAIAIETNGGMPPFGLSFKRGVIEGISVDLAQTRSAVEFINWAIQTNARKGA